MLRIAIEFLAHRVVLGQLDCNFPNGKEGAKQCVFEYLFVDDWKCFALVLITIEIGHHHLVGLDRFVAYNHHHRQCQSWCNAQIRSSLNCVACPNQNHLLSIAIHQVYVQRDMAAWHLIRLRLIEWTNTKKTDKNKGRVNGVCWWITMIVTVKNYSTEMHSRPIYYVFILPSRSSGSDVNAWFAELQRQFSTKIAIKKNILNKSIFQYVPVRSLVLVTRCSLLAIVFVSISIEFSRVSWKFLCWILFFFSHKNLVQQIIYLYLIISKGTKKNAFVDINFFLSLVLFTVAFHACVLLCNDFIVSTAMETKRENAIYY